MELLEQYECKECKEKFEKEMGTCGSCDCGAVCPKCGSKNVGSVTSGSKVLDYIQSLRNIGGG